MAELTPKGEVANFLDVDQFQPGKSAYECGYFAVYQNACAAQPPGGKILVGGDWITAKAEAAYAKFNGSNDPGNKSGMSTYQLYLLISEVGCHYHILPPEILLVKQYLAQGYGVILGVKEDSVYDDELGKVPYAWKATGNHIITATGVSGDELLLCRDTASIAPDGVRPGPRKYDASKLSLVSATAFVYPWLIKPGTGHVSQHTYTIVSGDTLSQICNDEHVSLSTILTHNLELLDDIAQDHGYVNSQEGRWIFPGTVLSW
jgi:LysM repeat protein